LFQQMTIVGVGLIGGSLGMICKQQGLVKAIVGTGRRVQNLKKAVERRAIDRYTTDLAEAAAGSDLLVLASPVGTFEAALRTCAPRLAPGAIVTDVGSVKGPLVERMEALDLQYPKLDEAQLSELKKAEATLLEEAKTPKR